MDRRRINHLHGLGRNVISITVAMFTGHCVMGRHAERMNITTSDVGADLLSKRRLLSIFFVNAHLSRGADIGYLAL